MEGSKCVRSTEGDQNPADLSTKPKSGGEMQEQLTRIGGSFRKRAADSGPWQALVTLPRVSWAEAQEESEDE